MLYSRPNISLTLRRGDNYVEWVVKSILIHKTQNYVMKRTTQPVNCELLSKL